MNRRVFLQSSAGAAGCFLVGSNPRAAAPSAATEEEWLARARAGIRKHRRGEGVIQVKDGSGQAVPGARVRVEQRRHEFLFGCNLFMWGRLGSAALDEGYRRQFTALLNFATLGFYWGNYERQRGRPMYDYTDQVGAWCHANQIRCKGHPLVWDYTADPPWLPADFAQIRELSHGRVRDIVRRYRGRIDVWDVVNEPTHLGRTKTRLSAWAQSLGAGPYVAEHLKVARAANPTATLLVNDYRTDPPFYQILDGLRENGKLLFDVVGIQSHMHGGLWPLPRIWEVCDQYARLGCPIHFTETTVASGPRGEGERWKPTTPELEEKQADAVAGFYTMLFGHPAVEALTWWDFSDKGAWQGAAAGLVRADMSPKPAYERLKNLIKGEWWTKAEGNTNAQGEFGLQAFFGVHDVVVTAPSGAEVRQEIEWRKGAVNRVEISL